MVSRLAHTLREDNERGGYNSLGAFADASHFARVCRAYTGQTPTYWRHMSQTFY
jgi:AraC-like DNA-binding protein